MPRTVEEGFRDFLAKLTPSGGESAAASSHRSSIEQCLKANFTVNRLWRTGSFGNGTSVYGASDVDYFVSVAPSDLSKNSEISLRTFREKLHRRFPSTGVRVNCPAIKVLFGSGLTSSDNTEIVPAFQVEDLVGTRYRVYGIPNCLGGWMRSSPDAHNAYVRGIDEELGGKVKPLVRFVKAWKYNQSVPISSFYLEIATAAHASAETVIEYDIALYLLLNKLVKLGLGSIKDPVGVSERIASCKTQSQIDEALSKLETAATRAEKAVKARKDRRLPTAFFLWKMFFRSGFPSYRY
jgi:hypothetical protein